MKKMTNEYTTEGGGPKLVQSLVVYADLLGFRNQVIEAELKGASQSLLEKLYAILGSAYHEIRTSCRAPEISFRMKSFTDNIVFGEPVWQDAEGDLGHYFLNLSEFQLTMILEGFFVRGAVAIGNFYMDDDLVYGPALLEAVAAEKDAKYPRIILAESVRPYLEKHLRKYGRQVDSPQYRELLTDNTNHMFLSYLDILLSANDDDPYPLCNHVPIHKAIIEAKLSEFKNDSDILIKYAWVGNYHNFFCHRNPSFRKRKYMIDQRILRPSFHFQNIQSKLI
jgi:hypothetical protein